jgi:hypothetical protein
MQLHMLCPLFTLLTTLQSCHLAIISSLPRSLLTAHLAATSAALVLLSLLPITVPASHLAMRHKYV